MVLFVAAVIQGSASCPSEPSADCPSGNNYGYNNTGGCDNVGCNNHGTGNIGSSNTGTGNKGDFNSGSNNVGRYNSGTGSDPASVSFALEDLA